MKAQKAQFQLEGSEQVFNGFTYGETWNGWERPLLPVKEADKLIKDKDINDGENLIIDWDEGGMTFKDMNLDGEVTRLERTMIDTVDGPVIVYDFTNLGWCFTKEYL